MQRPDGEGSVSDGLPLSVEQLLYRAIVDCEIEALDKVHVLIVTDQDTRSTYSGPYPDALAALQAAHEERRRRTKAGIEEGCSFCIAPVYPSRLEDLVPDPDETG